MTPRGTFLYAALAALLVGMGASLAAPGNLALLALGGVAALSLVIFAAALSRRHPWVVLFPFAAVIALTPKEGAAGISIGGRSWLPIDFVATIAAVAAIFGLRHLSANLRGFRLPAAVFVSLTVLQFLVGLGAYGTSAVLEVRGYVALLAVTSFVASLPDVADAARLVRRWLYWTASTLVVVAAFRAATQGLGNANDLGENYVTTRVIISSQAVLVGAAFLLAAHEWFRGRGRKYAWGAVAFGSVVVVAQHRSVWVAVGVGCLTLLPTLKAGKVITAALVAAWAAIPIFALMALTSMGQQVVSALQASLSTFSLSSGTGGDRTESAQIFIARVLNGSLDQILFGQPFGVGWAREVNGRVETFQPHDAYVQALSRVGAVGVLAIMLILLRAVARGRRGVTPEQTSLAWVAMFATYSLAYGFPFELAPCLAVAMLWAPPRPGLNPQKSAEDVLGGWRRTGSLSPAPPLVSERDAVDVVRRGAGGVLK